jgi:hypothetical protein
MEDLTYLNSKSGMGHIEMLKLAYPVFLSYLKHHRIIDLRKTEEGREYLGKVHRFHNPRKKADLAAIRSFGGYTAKGKDGEK